MEIKLGNKVKDKVTGFTGIAITKCIFLNGCIQFALQPKANKDGEVPKSRWVDIQQLEYIEMGMEGETKPTGGGFREHPV